MYRRPFSGNPIQGLFEQLITRDFNRIANDNAGPRREYRSGNTIQDLFDQLLARDYNRAASDRYRQAGPRFQHGSEELWHEVIHNEGKVDFYTAKQFLESHNNKYFQKNSYISDVRTRQPLKNLGFETIINLYDAMTERPMQDNSLYLDLLNQSIDLSKDELTEWTRPVTAFWSEQNKPFIEKKWEEAKDDGLIARSEGTFAQTMAEGFDNPQLISKGGYIRRKAILQFISDAYSDFADEDRVQIELIKGPPGLGGFHTVDERTGQHVIGININNFAFQSNFQSIMNVLNHERYHASDRMLGDQYSSGNIREGDPNYKRARIAAAAMSKHGYISGDAEAGPLAYRDQVIEVGAHHAGKLAEYHTHETYAKEPDPVIGIRGDKERQLLAQEYEEMAMRRARVQYPQGLSPFDGLMGRRLEIA